MYRAERRARSTYVLHVTDVCFIKNQHRYRTSLKIERCEVPYPRWLHNLAQQPLASNHPPYLLSKTIITLSRHQHAGRTKSRVSSLHSRTTYLSSTI